MMGIVLILPNQEGKLPSGESLRNAGFALSTAVAMEEVGADSGDGEKRKDVGLRPPKAKSNLPVALCAEGGSLFEAPKRECNKGRREVGTPGDAETRD